MLSTDLLLLCRMDKSYSIDTNTWEEGMAYEQARDLYILTHQFTPTGNKSNKERYRTSILEHKS